MGLDSRVIVYDGANLFTTRLSPRIRPFGGEVDILAVRHANDSPERANFPFNPGKLPMSVVDVDAVRKHVGAKLEAVKKASGNICCSFKLEEGVSVEFTGEAKQGYNVTVYRVFLKEGTHLCQDEQATWEKAKGVWFVNALQKKIKMLNGSESRQFFAYDKFDPNAEVTKDFFTLKALTIPGGARIIDHQGQGKPRFYYYPAGKRIEQKNGESILDAVRKMTERP